MHSCKWTFHEIPFFITELYSKNWIVDQSSMQATEIHKIAMFIVARTCMKEETNLYGCIEISCSANKARKIRKLRRDTTDHESS